jgi:hypothetical protein
MIELRYLISFLGLLKQVATYSTAARMTLFENQSFRVLESLSSLLDCPVSSSLKAALFECIAAFCKPQTHGQNSMFALGNQQADITSSVWLMLESHQGMCLGLMYSVVTQEWQVLKRGDNL